MSMKGRSDRFRKIKQDDFVRERIKTAELVKSLTVHALGAAETMTPSQVTAALGLLKKSLPDLAAQQIKINGNQTLLDILAGFSAGAANPEPLETDAEGVRDGSAQRFDA